MHSKIYLIILFNYIQLDINKSIAISNFMIEYCNICDEEVNNVNEHINTIKHKSNIEKILSLFKDKIYEDNRIGIEP